jgi:glycosyltransferase involved in cell wall biosynthesis
MSTVQLQTEQEVIGSSPVSLLYICDFPPSNAGGGCILMKRLLQAYPVDRLTVFTGSPNMRDTHSKERLGCCHVAFPMLQPSPVRWIGRIKHVLSWLLLAYIAANAVFRIYWRKVGTILTILHGRYYFAAAAAGWLTSKPYIVVVHDDFISQTERATWFSRKVVKSLTGLVLRRAAHVYSVSPGMQRLLREEFRCESEVQWPATERDTTLRQRVRTVADDFVILFAGAITYANEDSLTLLAELISSGELKQHGMLDVKLHVCTKVNENPQWCSKWSSQDLVIKDWLSQSELSKTLAEADMFFLPYSFRKSSRHGVQTAFPSKTADYLAAGKPILILAPWYSSLARYASEEGFAEVVTEFSVQVLADAIRKVALSPDHRAALSRRALQAFASHHDIHDQRRKFQALVEAVSKESLRGRLAHL